MALFISPADTPELIGTFASESVFAVLPAEAPCAVALLESRLAVVGCTVAVWVAVGFVVFATGVGLIGEAFCVAGATVVATTGFAAATTELVAAATGLTGVPAATVVTGAGVDLLLVVGDTVVFVTGWVAATDLLMTG